LEGSTVTTATADAYSAKLRDPRWQKMRLKILERDEWSCNICGDDTSTLHVHHRHYLVGAEPWEYPEELLTTLCESCHEQETEDAKHADAQLLMAVHEKFTAADISRLAYGIRLCKPQHIDEVVATAYAEAFADQVVQQALLSRVFDRTVESLTRDWPMPWRKDEE
jgi:hypothetical protein